MTRGRAFVAAALVGALVFAACGGDDDDDDATEEPSDDTEAPADDTADDTAEAEPLKVGIVYVDYSAIADFVDFERGDQEAIAQALVDDINESGRVPYTIEPVFQEYPPIPGSTPSPLDICTKMADDEQVFAVLGVFIDFTGEGQLCLTRDKNTVHVGHEMQDAWLEEASPGLLISPGNSADQDAELLINLLDEEGTLDGKKVAILADDDSQTRVDETIEPGLEGIGADLGTTAILTVEGTDTSAAQAQLDAAVETWKSEGVDTIWMVGLTASSKQFVDRFTAEIPGLLLIADSGSTAEQAQDAVAAAKTAGEDPVAGNPYEGMLGLQSQSRSERWAAPNEKLQHCIDVVEEALGHEIIGPDELTPNENGKNVEEYVAVEDFCDELEMLLLGLEAAGPGVTTESWSEAILGLGGIVLPTADVASICEDKYVADDQRRLVEFDSTIGESGDWSGITELTDVSGGVCG